MEQSNQDAVDDRPADAVSALRSRFEKLGERPATPSSTSTRTIPINVANKISTTPQITSRAASPAPNGSLLPPPVPRKPSTMAGSRPQSMILPSDPPPETEVNKTMRPLIFTAQSLPFERHSVDIVRPIVRAGTDTLSTAKTEFVDGGVSSRGFEQSIRPQVPVKKPNLSSQTRPKSVVETTQSESEVMKEVVQEIQRPVVDTSVAPQTKATKPGERKRVDSDASWVEHLPDTPEYTPFKTSANISDTDLPLSRSPDRYSTSSSFRIGKTRPKRVQSNASWVENIDEDESPRVSPRKAYAIPHLPDVVEQPPKLPTRPAVLPQEDIPQYTPMRRQQTIERTPQRSNLPTNETPRKKSAAADAVSALSQGFDRRRSSATSTQTLHAPPQVPAPRRSLDRRRELERPSSSHSIGPGHASTTDLSDAGLTDTAEASPAAFPDSTMVNRRPPRPSHRPWHIPTGYDTRTMAVCNDIVCTTGYLTRAWDLSSGEEILGVPHQETVKITAVVFKPTLSADMPCTHIWLGTTLGEIHEVEIESQAIVKTSQKAHRGRGVIKLYRHDLDIWSLDESGDLVTWQRDRDGLPSPHSAFMTRRVHSGHNYSIVCDGLLWLASGKDIRIYKPSSTADSDFFITQQPLTQPNLGEVTSAATLKHRPEVVYFGHSDGKISIYNRATLQCERVVHASLYKIHALTGVGKHLWAGFGTGTIQVYDVSTQVWQIKKEWHAHEKQICSICVDVVPAASDDPLRVVTLATDNTLKLWDGYLEEDWICDYLSRHDDSFCNFSELQVAVLTWNAGASKPSHLENSKVDSLFLQQYLNHVHAADVLIFGFQELVDLEDKKLTARSFFKSKKKDAFEQEHMSHQYRAWRDYLSSSLQACAPREYTLLHTASMIGLFSCCFVRSSLRHRIKYVHQAEVKRGMGGHYGNKGALVLRMVFDDSSLCFVNCHLAAGQTQTSSRNNDAAAILDAENLPANPLVNEDVEHSDVFSSGGTGSMILDHEICILNGDLNYRIDTMSRDTVIKHIQQENLKRLLERDQLLLSRKKYPGFRLRAFQEKAITFEPTYKYNVSSNEYDTSEKRRSPAWCDRILYRGVGKVKCDEYRRWEVRISDHRPVSALIKCRVKKVDRQRRVKVLERCIQDFTVYRDDLIASLQ